MRFEIHRFADFVGENLADTLQVAAETHTVGLYIHASDFRDKLIKKRVLVTKDIQVVFHRSGLFNVCRGKDSEFFQNRDNIIFICRHAKGETILHFFQINI